MKKVNHDYCEKKHCKCRGFLKFVFGVGILGLLAHMVYGWIDPDKKNALKELFSRNEYDDTDRSSEDFAD